MLKTLENELNKKNPKAFDSLQTYNLLTTEKPPELNLYLLASLQKSIIPKNTLLVQSIATIKTKEDLIPVALALRYGGNPNLYVSSADLGQVHIIIYSYYKINKNVDTQTLNYLMWMLQMMGSDPDLPAYSNGQVRSSNFNDQAQSVRNWLDFQNYKITKYQNSLPQDITYLASLLNRNGLINKSTVNSTDFFIPVIKSYADTVLKGNNDKLEKSKKFYYLKQSIDAINVSAWRYLLSQGYLPSYVTINYLISKMSTYRNMDDGISYGQLFLMMEDVVKNGGTLSLQQFTYLERFDKASADRLRKEYENPKWVKVCRSVEHSQGDETYLRTLAYWLNLDLDMDTKTLCQEIRKVAQANPKAYLEAAIRRQHIRVSSSVSDAQEYINRRDNDVISKYLCINRDTTNEYPYLYNDLDLLFYKDNANNTWCLTPDMFETIRQTGRNPISQEILPNEVQQQLTNQRNTLKRLGLLDVPNKTIADALKEMRSNDRITNQEIEDRRKSLRKLTMMYCASPNNKDCNGSPTSIGSPTNNNGKPTICNFVEAGVSQLESLNKQQMINLLEKWGLSVKDLGFDAIDTGLLNDTFLYIVYNVLKSKPELTGKFFNDVEQELRKSTANN